SFFFSSRRRHTISDRDWSSDVCSSDLAYGFRLHAIAPGQCTLDVPFQPLFERPGGIVGGQVFMAAADVAMWLAIMTRLGSSDGSVTAAMTSAFLDAARHESFRCTARVVKLGRRLVYGV